MDPSVCLDRILAALAERKDLAKNPPPPAFIVGKSAVAAVAAELEHQRRLNNSADELIEAFEDLHAWLRSGGFKPEQWCRLDGSEPKLNHDECSCPKLQCAICKTTWELSK